MSETVSKVLEPGQYESVVPVVDSNNGEVMSLTIVEELPKQLPPVRNPTPLIEVVEDMLRDIRPLGPDQMVGADAALYLMRQSAWRYDDLRKFVVCYEDLHSFDLHPERQPGTKPSFEEACDLAGIGYDHLLGLLTQACYWYGIQRAKAVIHLALPDIMKANADTASTPGKEGLGDRKLAAQMAGLIQEQQGVQVNVNTQVNNQTNLNVGLPQWDDVDKLLVKPVVIEQEG